MRRAAPRGVLAAIVCALLTAGAAHAQAPGAGPPAVGVVEARREPLTQTNEFVGRVEAVNRVDVVARVTAFLEKRYFDEGAEVKKGDLLYRLEQGPFQADVAAKQAQVAQLQAQLENARLTAERARTLLGGPAGQQSTYDAAVANQRSLEAQVQAAQAQLQVSQINLGYTEIRSPIDGKIGRTAVTEGNVVGPSSGALTTIVSQDPMYVTFPVPVREALELRAHYLPRGGFTAVVIRIRRADGQIYNQTGKLDFVSNTIAPNTDTITLRGTIPNPPIFHGEHTAGTVRDLTDGEFVGVLLEGVQPLQVLAVPRAAVLSDQRGDYVYVVGADNKAEQRRVNLGQSTQSIAGVISGINEGDKVIVEGLQRVRPGIAVAPGPASPQVQSAMQAAQSGDNQGQAASSGGPAPGGRGPSISGQTAPAMTGGPKTGQTGNAPSSIAPPVGQASSGAVGGANPAPSGGPSTRH